MLLGELHRLEVEREAIEAAKPETLRELAEWWDRLGEWWRRRDLSFGDGSGMMRHCFARAEAMRAREKLAGL